MAGSFGRCVLNDVRNCQTVFQTGCTILHFHQVYKISIWSMLISSFFFILDILIGLWWYLSVVLIGISLVTQYSASFSCSFAIHTSIFCLFKDFAHIWGEKWLFLFFLEFENFHILCIEVLCPTPDLPMFFPSLWHVLILQIVLNLNETNSLIFFCKHYAVYPF